MKLDKRIEALTDIQSVTSGCHDRDLHKKGYFANCISDFSCISNCYYGEYKGYTVTDKCFQVEFKDCGFRHDFRYFLPEDSLLPVEPEKKYRAFTLNEFVTQYSLGDEVIMRSKNNPTVTHVLFVEYEEGKDDVRLGQCWYTFMILFNNYELYIDGEWKPFGIEE